MKALLIETEVDGHYLILYLKFIIRILNNKKYQVFLITSKKAKNHKSVKSLLKECKNLKIIYIKTPKLTSYSNLDLVIYQVKLYFVIKKIFKKLHNKLKFDSVFVNSIDHFEKALSIFGDPFQSVKFSGIYVNPKFHMKEIGFGKVGRFNLLSKFLFLRVLKIKNLKNIFTNDAFFIKNIKKNYDKYSKKLNFLYEPREFVKAPSRLSAKKILKISINSTNILVYGSCKKSKGIENLLKIFNDVSFSRKLCVTIAGSQDPFIKNLLMSSFCQKLILNKKLFIFSGFQDDYAESLLFNSADLVWIGYEENFPFLSGVLYQAAIKKKPILATNNGIIGWMCNKYKLGYAFNPSDTKLLKSYINKITIKHNYRKFVQNSLALAKISKPKLFIEQFENHLIK